MLQIREEQKEDAPFLPHLNARPSQAAEPLAHWEAMLEQVSQDENYHLLVGTLDGRYPR